MIAPTLVKPGPNMLVVSVATGVFADAVVPVSIEPVSVWPDVSVSVLVVAVSMFVVVVWTVSVVRIVGFELSVFVCVGVAVAVAIDGVYSGAVARLGTRIVYDSVEFTLE